MTVVLDASALLAYLQDEPGSEVVDGVLAESIMSSVNWAEVVQKSIAAGVEVEGMLDDLQALGLRVEPFTPEDGELTGRLWEQTRQAGLSLGDRACLSLGLRLKCPVLTSDRAWASLSLSLDVQVIR
ncbi:MAG: type II toxin-antitoxin system VapC family toxin [Xenococcus sp. (in: cyanobacteria)]